MTPDVIEASEGTVVMLGSVRVGVGNIWEREYDPGDGPSRRDLTAMLFLDDDRRLVAGAGTVVTLAGGSWRVLDVVSRDRAPGRIRLAPVV